MLSISNSPLQTQREACASNGPGLKKQIPRYSFDLETKHMILWLLLEKGYTATNISKAFNCKPDNIRYIARKSLFFKHLTVAKKTGCHFERTPNADGSWTLLKKPNESRFEKEVNVLKELQKKPKLTMLYKSSKESARKEALLQIKYNSMASAEPVYRRPEDRGVKAVAHCTLSDSQEKCERLLLATQHELSELHLKAINSSSMLNGSKKRKTNNLSGASRAEVLPKRKIKCDLQKCVVMIWLALSKGYKTEDIAEVFNIPHRTLRRHVSTSVNSKDEAKAKQQNLFFEKTPRADGTWKYNNPPSTNDYEDEIKELEALDPNPTISNKYRSCGSNIISLLKCDLQKCIVMIWLVLSKGYKTEHVANVFKVPKRTLQRYVSTSVNSKDEEKAKQQNLFFEKTPRSDGTWKYNNPPSTNDYRDEINELEALDPNPKISNQLSSSIKYVFNLIDVSALDSQL